MIDEGMDAGGVFDEVAADVVSYVKYEALLLRVFSAPPGRWCSLLELDWSRCGAVEEAWRCVAGN